MHKNTKNVCKNDVKCITKKTTEKNRRGVGIVPKANYSDQMTYTGLSNFFEPIAIRNENVEAGS